MVLQGKKGCAATKYAITKCKIQGDLKPKLDFSLVSLVEKVICSV